MKRGSFCRVVVNACRSALNVSRRFWRFCWRAAFFSARVSLAGMRGILWAGRDGLLIEAPGAVGRAHERPAHDTGEADRLGLRAQLDELVRLDPARDRMVPR